MEFKIFFLLWATNPSTELYYIKDIYNYASLVKRIKKRISQKVGTYNYSRIIIPLFRLAVKAPIFAMNCNPNFIIEISQTFAIPTLMTAKTISQGRNYHFPDHSLRTESLSVQILFVEVWFNQWNVQMIQRLSWEKLCVFTGGRKRGRKR